MVHWWSMIGDTVHDKYVTICFVHTMERVLRIPDHPLEVCYSFVRLIINWCLTKHDFSVVCLTFLSLFVFFPLDKNYSTIPIGKGSSTVNSTLGFLFFPGWNTSFFPSDGSVLLCCIRFLDSILSRTVPSPTYLLLHLILCRRMGIRLECLGLIFSGSQRQVRTFGVGFEIKDEETEET